MQPSVRKVEIDLLKTMSRSGSIKIMKPETTQNKMQKGFRLSLTNFRVKRQSDGDIGFGLSSPTATCELKEKPIQRTVRTDVVIPNRSEIQKGVSPLNLNVKQPGIRIVKYHPHTPTGQSQRMPGFNMPSSVCASNHQDPPLFQAPSGHKRSMTLTCKRPIIQMPIDLEAASPSSAKNTILLSTQDSYKHSSQDEQQSTKQSICHLEEKNSHFTNYCAESSDINYAPSCRTRPYKSHRKTISISDSLMKSTSKVINYSTNASSYNTLLHDTPSPFVQAEDEKRLVNFAIAKDSVKNFTAAEAETNRIEALTHGKNFKTVDRLVDAKEKALHYNDQLIRQYQFNQDDEDEEANFQQLCDVFISHH